MAILPSIRTSISPSINLFVEHDRTQTIRASVKSIQETLLLTVVLVILVIFVFLRNFWSTVIPAVSVPVSLVGTFGVLYLCGYSVDNLSLMALAIATGFVVDDAIVVIENITRYLEKGFSPLEAALKGSREIGFTVLSMSTSLVAVFIPILLMSGIVGRVFREFAVTLSIAIGVSLLVSLTVTPMMCARFLKPVLKEGHNWLYRRERAQLQCLAGSLWPRRPLGTETSAADAGNHDRHRLLERSSLLLHTEGIFPAAGCRRDERVDSSGTGHVL